MNILVIGGTRYFGKRAVRALVSRGHSVTVANRGISSDDFADGIKRVALDRTSPDSVRRAVGSRRFDVIFDSIAYCSRDVECLLDNAECGRYVFTSSTAVYDKHPNTVESDFDPLAMPYIPCGRGELPYNEGKRQVERIVFQKYADIPAAAVRFPFVISDDDYTGRLRFYVENILRGIPLYIDNLNSYMSFVHADEAGDFLSHICELDFTGCVNGASRGVFSLREITDYVTEKTGERLVISSNGIPAPYNGEKDYSINTNKAEMLGFSFADVKNYMYGLIDSYIESIQNEKH